MMWLEVLAGSCLFAGIIGLAYTILAALLARGDDL